MASALSARQQLAEEVGLCYADPLRFVRLAYPWGEPGPLADHPGPDTWQVAFLTELGTQVKARKFDGGKPVDPIRMAVSSGHGIGKSVMVAWLVNWIMSTRPHARGTLTANTYVQLQTRTWASVQRWTKLCLTRDWFTVNAERLYQPGYKESWFASMQSCREENSEAFAGQHAADSTSFYILDEASAIPDAIWDVAEGGLTDGEPMIFAFGNPTRSSGRFHRVCFGADRQRWTQTIVDSRESRFTNHGQIQQWIDDFGEDSDFVRVRVRGLPPAASDVQFIGADLVRAAQEREVFALSDDPLIAGLDVARGGSDSCVIRFRRGADARSIPAIRIPGEQARDSTKVIAVAAEVLAREYHGRRVAALFVDATGIGGPIADRLRQLGHKGVYDVQFGGSAVDTKYANMRAFMWGRLRDWLRHGAIDTSAHLEQDLVGPGYMHDKKDRLLLESKEQMKARGLDSPDDGDALALTFAMPVNLAAPTPSFYTGQDMRSPMSWAG